MTQEKILFFCNGIYASSRPVLKFKSSSILTVDLCEISGI